MWIKRIEIDPGRPLSGVRIEVSTTAVNNNNSAVNRLAREPEDTNLIGKYS